MHHTTLTVAPAAPRPRLTPAFDQVTHALTVVFRSVLFVDKSAFVGIAAGLAIGLLIVGCLKAGENISDRVTFMRLRRRARLRYTRQT